MRLLLDTHALIWWLFDDPKLPAPARRAIADPDNEILVSSASAWEIATKHRRGKLPEAGDLAEQVRALRHRIAAHGAAHQHRARARGRSTAWTAQGSVRPDPDRAGRLESLVIVTADPVFADYDAKVVWN